MKNHIDHGVGSLVLLALTAIRCFAQSTYEPYTFSTLAGGSGYSTNVAGSAARRGPPLRLDRARDWSSEGGAGGWDSPG